MLSRTEGRCRALLDAIHDYAICYLDPDGTVLSWNTGAERIAGYRPNEIIGQSFAWFYTTEDRQSERPALTLRRAAQLHGYEQRAWRVRSDGTRFWAHVVMRAIRDEAGVIIGFSKVTRNATKSDEETDAPSESGRRAVQAARREAVGRLAGGVAHEFNNLLAAISGNIELAQKRVQSQRPIANLLENALSAAAKAADLTALMLASARRQTLRPKPVDLCVVASRIVERLRFETGLPIAMGLSSTQGAAVALADAAALERAMTALVRNAADAVLSGGEVWVGIKEKAISSKHADLEPGRYIVATIADTGVGMDAETHRQAFDPFFTTKATGQGKGLGLPVAQGFAAQSGGGLFLKTERGVGTQVQLWLPVSGAAVIVGSSGARTREAREREGRVALVVDDDPSVLETTAGLLNELGFQTLQAKSAQEALSLLIDHREVSLLVTDDTMPLTTGSELAAQVERIRPGLEVLLVSGYTEPCRPESLGPAALFLAKPFDLAMLSRALDALEWQGGFRPDLGPIGQSSGHDFVSRLTTQSLDREVVDEATTSF